MLANEFALIIPTLNRHHYIINLVKFYESLNVDIGIFIGDGSNSCLFEDIKFIRGKSSNVAVHYFHLPGIHVHQTQHFLVEKAYEHNYYAAAFCGDDDFINPFVAMQMVMFLRENPDFASVQGQAYIGEHPFNGANQFGFHDLREYWSKPAEYSNNKTIRSCNILKNYWVPHFSVKRTYDYLSILSNDYIAIKNFTLGEILQSINTIALGKSYFYDKLYLIRGSHELRGFDVQTQCFLKTPENIDLKTFNLALHKLSIDELDRSLLDAAFSYYQNKLILAKPVVRKLESNFMPLIRKKIISLLKSWLPISFIQLTRKIRYPSIRFLNVNQLDANEVIFINRIYINIVKGK
jgi:glycosyltransferase domain-containing protein